MAFNLNKLVQPECGAPNPLVSAARQITMRPSSIPSLRQARPQSQSQLNLTREFLERNIPSLPSTSTTSIPTLNKETTSHPTHNQVHSQHRQQQQQQYIMRQNLAYPMMNYANETTSTQQPLAGEQLETKYRDDMISQTSSQGKLDDVEFWQALSQQYIGPNTFDTIAKMRRTAKTDENGEGTSKQQEEDLSNRLEDQLTTNDDGDFKLLNDSEREKDDMNYIFDERNPLKNQYENPFEEGLKRLEQGDIPSAALLFEAAVQKEPDNPLAWRYLGTTQAQNEKDSCAIKALKNCIRLDKNDQSARLAIAVSLVNETQHVAACEYLLSWLINNDKYQQVNASLEDFRQIQEGLSNDLFTSNDKHLDYVRDRFVAAARMSPNNLDPDVQNSLGVLFNMRGEYDKAVDCFKAALSVRSGDSSLWNRLGATLANGNKSDEAVIAYRRALEISPGFLRSRYNLAISLIHLNLYDEAAKQLVQILNMQAAGKGDKNIHIRTRSITSTSIWNTLRTVATLMNKPDYYSMIDGRDLDSCNRILLSSQSN